MEPIKRSLSRSPQCVFWLVVLALAGGCGTEPPVPASIAISPDSATLLWSRLIHKRSGSEVT